MKFKLGVSNLIVVPIAVIAGLGSLQIQQIPLLTALAAAKYVVPQIAIFWLITRTTAVKAALPNYLAPLIAIILAVPILQQPITLLIIAGGIPIIAGTVLVYTALQRTTKNQGSC